jgi:hypothetical protein
LGNCVGRKNYRFFIYFLSSVVIQQTYSFAICLYSIIKLGFRISVNSRLNGTIKEIKTLPIIKEDYASIIISFALIVYICITSYVVLKLLIYHIILMTKNLTTYQDIKQNFMKDIDYFFVNVQNQNRKFTNLFGKLSCKRIGKMPWFNPNGVYEPKDIIKGIFYESHHKEENIDKENICVQGDKIKSITDAEPINSKFNYPQYRKNLNNQQRFLPGELHFSENEINNEIENTELKEEEHNQYRGYNVEIDTYNKEGSFEQDSLNKKIFSIINSSGTVEDNEDGNF